jgi:hypothetical protein
MRITEKPATREPQLVTHNPPIFAGPHRRDRLGSNLLLGGYKQQIGNNHLILSRLLASYHSCRLNFKNWIFVIGASCRYFQDPHDVCHGWR